MSLHIHVNVLDDGGGGSQKQGGNSGDSGCNGSDNNDAGPEGGQALDNGNGNNIIHTAVGFDALGENTLTEHTNPSSDQGHDTDYNGADNHGSV